MSLTVAPVLHRFIPRRARETTTFGYEVAGQGDRLDDCVGTVQWIDCWCPDAAQFILVEASKDLNANTCPALIGAIAASHLRHKIRLVCSHMSLQDSELLRILHQHEIGYLLANGNQTELTSWAEKGILGVRVNANDRLDMPQARRIIRSAHDLGMRVIASQISTPEAVRDLLGMGCDYVSERDGGFTPPDSSFAWKSRLEQGR